MSKDRFLSQDSILQQAVLAELSWETSVVAAHIGVTANAGVVTLMGNVESHAGKHAAEAAARRVTGVKVIVGEIEVRLPPDTLRSDAEVAAAAIDRLACDVSIPPGSIKVKVEKGWLTLTGQVQWSHQKVTATDDVRGLFGVLGVSDQTTIKPEVNVSNIRDDILHALQRSRYLDPRTINVSAEGGEVRLTGSVRSSHDRQLAVVTAWSAPGTICVEDDLAIV